MSTENKQEAATLHKPDDMTPKKIWKVFFYLLGLTAIEFIIALVFVHGGIIAKGPFVISIYIVLTLIKAYYIVAYFMHLKFETKGFITLISISMILLIYFIILLFTEGGYLMLHLFK